MPTIYSTEHEVFRHSLRRFLDKELVKPYERFNTKDGVNQFWRKAGDAGLLGSCFAPEYGGAGGRLRLQRDHRRGGRPQRGFGIRR